MPEAPVRYILDSSFFLSGFQLPEGHLFTVPEVVAEVREDRKELRFAVSLGLVVREPDAPFVGRIEEAAEKSGDIFRMSGVDVKLLALALELEGVLITDDYSMQNTAALVGIRFESRGERGITRVETWYHRCRYCGVYQERHYPDCPICGGPMRTTRKPPHGTDGM
jgi:UPF0271 protein